MSDLGNDLIFGDTVRHSSGRKRTRVLSAKDRSMHLHIVGATGTGKSKFLEHLIWQDCKNWHKSKCGLIMLDPHGSVYESLVRRLSFQVDDPVLPVIPIDLTQDEWIVSYNPIRQRPDVPDVNIVINSFVHAMAHVFGQADTTGTPRFDRWATNILSTLYENKHTLADVAPYIDRHDKRSRKLLTSEINDPFINGDWQYLNALNPGQVDNEVGSTINRVRPFVNSKTLQCIFGNPDVSLDLDRALEEGWIILVNMSQARGLVQSKDTQVMGTLILHDLWMAAQRRGKRPGLKPFYVYLDEFQKFVTPDIADSLDEARGYGLHFTLSHQFPSQVSNGNPDFGKQLYDSLLNNARNKVVFQLNHPEDLKHLATYLFRSLIDPGKIKHEIWSTKVMDYRIEYQTGYSTTVSDSEGGSESSSQSSGESRSTGASVGESISESKYRELNDMFAEYLGITDYLSATDSQGTSRSSSHGSAHSVSESHGRSSSWSRGKSETISSTPMLRPIMGKELSSVQFESVEEQLFRAMAVLSDQKQRQFITSTVSDSTPERIFTPFVRESSNDDITVKEYLEALYEKWDFALPRAEVQKMVDAREKTLLREFEAVKKAALDPASYKRPLKEKKPNS
jgi:hypothetical protein